MRRRKRQHRDLHGPSADGAALGRFRKKHPYDCGRPGCQVCHFEKVHGLPSVSRRRADEAFAAELENLG